MSEMSEILTVDQILAADDLLTEILEVPAWGGALKVRGLTASEKNSLAKISRSGSGGNIVTIDTMKAQFAVVQMGVVTPKIGIELYEPMMNRSASAIGLVYDKIIELSGMNISSAGEESANGVSFQIT